MDMRWEKSCLDTAMELLETWFFCDFQLFYSTHYIHGEVTLNKQVYL